EPSDHSLAAPPDVLPRSAQSFLADACGLSIDIIVQCWSAFKDVAWCSKEIHTLFQASSSTFHKHTARTLYPPSQSCLASSCPCTLECMHMMHAEQRHCVLYMLANGPLPIYSVHLSCEVCEINYHHNFKVFKGERTYYGGIPDTIQISEHQFVERQVIEMWLSLMDQCMSITACAQFYNTAMFQSNEPPLGWPFGFSLSLEHVWSAFLLYCLLKDAVEREEYLIITHTGDHKDHFNDLVQAQNQHIHIEGQPEVMHFCDKCTCWYINSNGKGEEFFSIE
ncbi:hypothetical protein L210DRAFT_869872, partial [Boletus edulis BED1]